MTMNTVRLLVMLAGILIPCQARFQGGAAWLAQYTDVGLGEWLLLGAFNAIA
jgi:hypothetical protein